MQWHRDIEVLTPLFNRGAYQDTPELRVPSIRGMVRWWFRALGGTPDDEKTAFGGMKGFGHEHRNEVVASRLVFRVSAFQAQRAKPDPLTLPHKSGGPGSPQAAFAPGATFHLEVFTRFGGLPADIERKVTNALEVWLLLGALGLRANRSGGNIWPAGDGAPQTPSDLRKRLDELGCHWPVYLAGLPADSTLDELRAAATDTLKGMPEVFGQAGGGRIASKVKFKIVRLDDRLRLLIFAPDQDTLEKARNALKGRRSKPETWVRIEDEPPP
ncbi:MAG TPA: type III-B CRISPR module RAMP protein Cmr1, partial [Candidatus Paceibacterota bacterium]|nr:type III-B CRISPR module RAMP protein Cmr1 [Candidatus Paceibacterota bacterium]